MTNVLFSWGGERPQTIGDPPVGGGMTESPPISRSLQKDRDRKKVPADCHLIVTK